MTRKILLIDDDKLVLKSIEKVLRSKRFEPVCCSNGHDAIDEYKKQEFSLIISDIRMAEQDGIDTIKKIRTLERKLNRRATPIFMITGYASENAPIEAIKIGVQDYFIKPFDTNDLLRSIDTHLNAFDKAADINAVTKAPKFNILGIGMVSPFGFCKEDFWSYINKCKPQHQKFNKDDCSNLRGVYCMQVEDFCPERYFDEKQMHNLDVNSMFVATSAQLAIQDSGLKVSKVGSDEMGVSVGTSVSIGTAMSDFDESVLRDGHRRSKIGIFPNTVMCAPASRISIFEHITGSNTTISSGMNSGIDAIGHACCSLESDFSKIMIAGGSDAISAKILLGFDKEELLFRSVNGKLTNKRGAFVPSEGACVLVLSRVDQNHPDLHVYAEISSYVCGFSPYKRKDTALRSKDLSEMLRECVREAGLEPEQLDCVLMSSYCDEFSYVTERLAVAHLLGESNKSCFVLAPKKMTGESFASYAPLMIALSIGLLSKKISPEAVKNLLEEGCLSADEQYDIKNVMVVHVDPAGHYGALIVQSKQ